MKYSAIILFSITLTINTNMATALSRPLVRALRAREKAMQNA